MPQLTIRGIRPEAVAAVSQAMCGELAGACGCPAEDFTLDVLQVVSVWGGAHTATFPFVEIAWFDRGRDVRNRVAEIVDRHLRQGPQGVAELEIAFKSYEKDAYFAQGRPFA